MPMRDSKQLQAVVVLLRLVRVVCPDATCFCGMTTMAPAALLG
jgi:hypothetical protein